MKVAINILNYNGLENTLECIESIRRLKQENFIINIMVIDNNSSDDSVEVLSKIKGINLIRNNKNLGYSGGNNVGIKYALEKGADLILLLNNDTIVDKSLIKKLIP